MPDGSWGNIKNLGATVNTPYNDDSPAIHANNRLLYFSSEGHNSIGGYDVFRTVLEIDNTWRKPDNIGYPVNTTGDDIYYMPGNDNNDYYSSGREGGKGSHDIYLTRPERAYVIPVMGKVLVDDKPVKAKVEISYQEKDSVVAVYACDSIRGSYFFDLPIGRKYTLVYKYDQFFVSSNIDATGAFAATAVTLDKKFYTAELRPLEAMKDSLTMINEEQADNTSIMEVAKVFGHITSPGLTFTVQVGAYNLSNTLKLAGNEELGKIEASTLSDGITRYTVGKCNNLSQASILRDKIRQAGIEDAFIVAIYKGKRVLIKELLDNNFFLKK